MPSCKRSTIFRLTGEADLLLPGAGRIAGQRWRAPGGMRSSVVAFSSAYDRRPSTSDERFDLPGSSFVLKRDPGMFSMLCEDWWRTDPRHLLADSPRYWKPPAQRECVLSFYL